MTSSSDASATDVPTADVSTTNKQLMQHIFQALSQGDSQPFLTSLAADVTWTLGGDNSWSGTYTGKQAVEQDLLRPLFAQFADQYTSHPRRFIADGDHVVVETQGRVTTNAGLPYNNSYCFVFRLEDGQVKEITEYCDTQLVATALDPHPG